MTKQEQSAPIGVFDSGLGGLTVAREIMRQLPGENMVYFGDTARLPYGDKSQSTIIRYSEQIIRFLRTKDVKAIVIACNTASALALETVRKNTDIPVIGVVEPGARAAAQSTENKKVGIIATVATIQSQIYPRVIHKLDEDISVIGKACPLFVPLVEEGLAKHHVTGEMIEYYLEPLKKSGIDSLILGCTHYPLLRSRIKEYMGDRIHLVNPAYETAMDLKTLLGDKNLLHENDGNTSYQFYVSDLADKFQQFADLIMPVDVTAAKQINIEEY